MTMESKVPSMVENACPIVILPMLVDAQNYRESTWSLKR